MKIEELIETLRNDVWVRIYVINYKGEAELEFSCWVRELKKHMPAYGSYEIVAINKHTYSDPRELEVYLEEI